MSKKPQTFAEVCREFADLLEQVLESQDPEALKQAVTVLAEAGRDAEQAIRRRTH